MVCLDCNVKMTVKKEPYHYVESGVNNIYLLGINVYHCPKCKSHYPEILEPELLHIVMAISFSLKKRPLTGQEIKFMRKEVGMTAKAFAKELGISPVSLSRWENGRLRPSTTNDRHVRHLFKLTMIHRLRTMMDCFEKSIEKAQVVQTDKRRVDINTEQLQYLSFPAMQNQFDPI